MAEAFARRLQAEERILVFALAVAADRKGLSDVVLAVCCAADISPCLALGEAIHRRVGWRGHCSRALGLNGRRPASAYRRAAILRRLEHFSSAINTHADHSE